MGMRTYPIYEGDGRLIESHRGIDPTEAPPSGYRWGPEGVLMKEKEWQRIFGPKNQTPNSSDD